MQPLSPAEVGERIRAERERARLSQRDVIDAAGILSQTTLHHIETGNRDRITATELDALANAIGVPMTRFLDQNPVRDRLFAQLRTEDPGEAASAAVDAAVELIELEERLTTAGVGRAQVVDVPDLSHLPHEPKQWGETAATVIRDKWGLGLAPIRNLEQLISEMTGVDVAAVELPEGVAGACMGHAAAGVAVIVVACNELYERQRFTIAHELGHLLAGDTVSVEGVGSDNTNAERRANRFASAFLMPEDGFRHYLAADYPSDPEVLARLARYFGVSVTAAAVRCEVLGLLTATQRSHLSEMSTWDAARRYGWLEETRADAELARTPRRPERLWRRALEGYEAGVIGVAALARLASTTPADMSATLYELGIAPAAPAPVPVDLDQLVARAKAS